MPQNEAGIELILSAPDVKSTMDEVIDAWKEIHKQEKLATEQLEKYNQEAEKEQLRLKEIALGNQKIKDAVKSRSDEEKRLAAEQGAQIDKQLFDQEHTQKGIFNTIKAYFQQRKELGNLGKEIDSVNKQLKNLDLRQQAISLSARRGNSVAIKEYTANEAAIKKLNASLNTLIERENVVGAKLDLTKQKFAGLNKAYNIAAAGAKAVAAGIALIGVAAFAVIVGLGKMNDQVQNQFKKTGDSFRKVREELSAVFSPVALAIGKVLEVAGNKLLNFLQDNAQAIFDWSKKVAGIFGYVAGYVEAFFPFVGNLIDKLTKDIEISLQALKLVADPTEFFKGGLATLEKLRKERAALSAEAILNPITGEVIEEGAPINPIDNAEKRQQQVLDFLGEYTLAQSRSKNLTDEQRKAIEKLREEYRRLTADLNKQIEALDVKEAGPFAGVLLKAQLAAREIEAQGELAVSVAKKLGKNKAEIDKIREAVSRLSQAVRDDAVKFLTDQSDIIIGNIQKKLEELRAARTVTSEDLKFKNDLEAQKKEIDIFRQITSTLIEDALNKADAVETINKYMSDLKMANELADALANNTALDFFSKKAVEKIQEEEKAAKESLKNLEDIAERLNKSLDSVIQAGDVKGVKDIQLRIRVNDIDIAVAREQIKQFEGAFEIFKNTGVLGVVETEAQIKVRISGGAGADIKGIQPNLNPETAGDTGNKRSFFTEGKELEESLDLAVGLNQIAFDTITSIALSSVDAQIEALDRLNEARAESVNILQAQLDREAQFKLNGLANDYDITKKQLDSAIKLQAEGAKKQEELNKKRARIQQQQNDAQTASSLFLAVANIISGWSTVPIVGSVLGIAAAAAMLISFAATKAQAAKVARAYKGSSRMGDTFGEFAPGEGYDDSPSRNRGLSVVDSRGRLRGFVGGDEFLHKQSVSRKHRKGFEYLNENEDKFKDVNLLAMLKAMEGTTVKTAFDFPDMSNTPRIDYARISRKNERLREKMIVVNQNNGVTKEELTEAIAEAMKGHAQTMIEYHESRPDIIPNEWFKDYTERTSKSSKRFKKG